MPSKWSEPGCSVPDPFASTRIPSSFDFSARVTQNAQKSEIRRRHVVHDDPPVEEIEEASSEEDKRLVILEEQINNTLSTTPPPFTFDDLPRAETTFLPESSSSSSSWKDGFVPFSTEETHVFPKTACSPTTPKYTPPLLSASSFNGRKRPVFDEEYYREKKRIESLYDIKKRVLDNRKKEALDRILTEAIKRSEEGDPFLVAPEADPPAAPIRNAYTVTYPSMNQYAVEKDTAACISISVLGCMTFLRDPQRSARQLDWNFVVWSGTLLWKAWAEKAQEKMKERGGSKLQQLSDVLAVDVASMTELKASVKEIFSVLGYLYSFNDQLPDDMQNLQGAYMTLELAMLAVVNDLPGRCAGVFCCRGIAVSIYKEGEKISLFDSHGTKESDKSALYRFDNGQDLMNYLCRRFPAEQVTCAEEHQESWNLFELTVFKTNEDEVDPPTGLS